MASVTLLLGNLETTLASNAAHTLAVERILVQVLKATDMTRNVARGLMPVGATPGALWRALERLAIDTNSLPGVACKFTLRGDWEQLPAATAHHAYRIVQEATTNALRGGGATRLHLMLSQKGMHRSIVVSDNGAGLQPLAKPGDNQQHALHHAQRQDQRQDQRQGVGMASMVARSKLMDADLRFSRVARGGTRLTLRWRDTPAAAHAI